MSVEKLKRSFRAVVISFKLFWKTFVFQSFLAAVAIFIVLLILRLQNTVIVASIGASAFIVFAMPEDFTAHSKNLIGGHLIGLICGFLCSLLSFPGSLAILSLAVYSFAVGLSVFLMVITNTKHPPAAGTALGVAIAGFSLNVTLAIIISVVILALIHHFAKPFLKDLM